MMRVPGTERLHVLLLPLTAHWFYHELWDKKYKNTFTLCNVLYAGLVLFLSPNPATIYVALALYYVSTCFFPMFHRMPENALKEWRLANKDKIAHSSLAESRKVNRRLQRTSWPTRTAITQALKTAENYKERTLTSKVVGLWLRNSTKTSDPEQMPNKTKLE